MELFVGPNMKGKQAKTPVQSRRGGPKHPYRCRTRTSGVLSSFSPFKRNEPTTLSEPPQPETMFGLGKLLYVIILTINGIAVLSEDRFLNRIGWNNGTNGNNASVNQYQLQFMAASGSDNYSIKTRLVNLIGAIRTLLRVPLIVVNVLIISYELILG